MALRFTLFLEFVHGLEKEDAVDLRVHEHRTGRGKPAIEMPGPRRKENVRRSVHYALDGQMERSGEEIGQGDGLGHDLAKES
jgi:hypothetical protein